MNYLKCLLINFLVIFFAVHTLSGIEVLRATKLPYIGGDLILAAVLGLLNSLIYPILNFTRSEPSSLKIALGALILNFAAYGIVRFLPVGVAVTSIEGYIIASAATAIGGFLTNFFEMKRESCDRAGPLP